MDIERGAAYLYGLPNVLFGKYGRHDADYNNVHLRNPVMGILHMGTALYPITTSHPPIPVTVTITLPVLRTVQQLQNIMKCKIVL